MKKYTEYKYFNPKNVSLHTGTDLEDCSKEHQIVMFHKRDSSWLDSK